MVSPCGRPPIPVTRSSACLLLFSSALQQRLGAPAHVRVFVVRRFREQGVRGRTEFSERLDHQVAKVPELGAKISFQIRQRRGSGVWPDLAEARYRRSTQI